MGMVTDIVDKRGQVEIWLDGVCFSRIRRAHFGKCPLEIGQDIDPDAYLEAVAAAQLPDAYEAALTALDASERSAQEVASALRRRGYVQGAIDAVVKRLRENRLLDDARYAQRMAELQSKRPMGIYAFKRRLRAKGISESDAQAAMDAFDEDQQREACLAAARSLIRKYESLPRRETRAKLSQALARRGFAWDAIESALDSILD